MNKIRLIQSLGSNRFGSYFLKLFCILSVIIFVSPFIDHYYQNKVDEGLNQEIYSVKSQSAALDNRKDFLQSKMYRGITKAENDELGLILELKASYANRVAKIAKERMERALRNITSTSWWAYIPIATSPVYFHSQIENLFTSSFSLKLVLWSAAINIALICGLIGYWKRKYWGCVAMGCFGVFYGTYALYESYIEYLLPPSMLLIQLLIVVLCLIPSMFLPWGDMVSRTLKKQTK